jgi:CheY-like chemotaxis protein
MTDLAPPPESARLKVLIIDDEDELLVAYQRLFGRHYELSLARGGREAVAMLEREPRWDAILCDIMMPDMDGTSVYEWVQENQPHLLGRLGFCTGGVFTPRSRELSDKVAGRLFEKPLSRAQVMAAVEELRTGAPRAARPQGASHPAPRT